MSGDGLGTETPGIEASAPHVNEGEGTDDWHFGEDSSFLLPDGTKISVNTEQWCSTGGIMVCTGIDILSGADHTFVGEGPKDDSVQPLHSAAETVTCIVLEAGTHQFLDGSTDDRFNGKYLLVGVTHVSPACQPVDQQMAAFGLGHTSDTNDVMYPYVAAHDREPAFLDGHVEEVDFQDTPRGLLQSGSTASGDSASLDSWMPYAY